MRMRFSCSLLKARKLIGRIPVKYQLTGKSHLTYQLVPQRLCSEISGNSKIICYVWTKTFILFSCCQDDDLTSMLASQSQKQNEHAFDLDAEAEPVPNDFTALDSGGGEFMDDFGNIGDDNEDNDAGNREIF